MYKCKRVVRVAPKPISMRKSLTGGVSWRCGNTVETPGAISFTGVISSSWVQVRGRQREFCRGAAVAPNLDHIASMKPGGRVNVLWCEIRIEAVARTKTRKDRWVGKEKQKWEDTRWKYEMTHCGWNKGMGIYGGKRVCLIIRRLKGEEAWTGEASCSESEKGDCGLALRFWSASCFGCRGWARGQRLIRGVV